MEQKAYNKILIAEDEVINFIFIKEILYTIEDINIEILHAKNGLEAVNMFKSNSDIDLIFMDIKMPIMNGLDAAKQIKDIDPDIPIVVQTAYASDSDRETAFASGCDAYLSKPIDTEEFIELTRNYLNN